MRFGGGQFLPARAQMQGAIPIRGADDRRHPSACGMGEAQRRRQNGLHQEQGRDQAREEGGGAFHGRVLNPVGGGCQGFWAESCARWVLPSAACAKLVRLRLTFRAGSSSDAEGFKTVRVFAQLTTITNTTRRNVCSPLPAGIDQEQLDLSETADHWAKNDALVQIVEALRLVGDFGL
jgi:hypothetical protein